MVHKRKSCHQEILLGCQIRVNCVLLVVTIRVFGCKEWSCVDAILTFGFLYEFLIFVELNVQNLVDILLE